MPRPFTLFTGQWADLPLEEICQHAREWGYDGLELACWGDHFEVDRALNEDGYLAGRHALLAKYGLKCWAISNHLVGQAVCDHPIDARHQAILPARIWGDGEPEGVRQRAAAEMADTARAAAAFGVDTVVGFTGSSIWHTVAMFPPVPASMIDEGYADFARPLEPDPGRVRRRGRPLRARGAPQRDRLRLLDHRRALEAVEHRPAFGLNFDPSHFVWQDLDPVAFLAEYRDRIYHVDCKEARKRLDGRSGRLGSHLPWGDPRRGWDFVSAGRGDIRWEDIFRMLNSIGYAGPISVEWEDAGHGPADRARPRRSPSCAGSTSTRRRPPSTPPSARRRDRLVPHPAGTGMTVTVRPSPVRSSRTKALPGDARRGPRGEGGGRAGDRHRPASAPLR